MNQVVCDVAVRTICVASDAPVSRTDVTLQSYNYQDGFLQQQDAGHPSAGETRRAVGPNHAKWLSSITNSRRKCATFST